MKLHIKGNEAIIEEDDGEGFASKLITAAKGRVKIKTPFGRRNLKFVNEFKTETVKPKAKRDKRTKAKAKKTA